MGSHVSLGPEIWPFGGGAGGRFVGWGPVMLVRDPTDKNHFGCLGIFLWLSTTAFALHNFLTVTTLGGSTQFLFENRDLLVFEGSGSVQFCGRPGPKWAKNTQKWIFPWGPICAKPPLTKFDRMLNVDPVNPVWGSMCPWGPGCGGFGGLGAILSAGDRFSRLGTQLTKKLCWP